MRSKLVVHVADVEIGLESGMGRVVSHWRDAIAARGHEFIHIGPSTVGRLPHPAWFPYRAWRSYQALNRKADVFLVHEPASGTFVNRGVPLVTFSHGLERRDWQLSISKARRSRAPVTLKQRISVPLLRLRQCDRGIRGGDLLLLTNREDAEFAGPYYARRSEDIFVFRNGVEPVAMTAAREPAAFTAFFNGSWIARKGIDVLAEAARLLHERSIPVKWMLGATQAEPDTIWESWPKELKADTQVIPTYPSARESDLLAGASVFVLPSHFEGQPLSLLQAMAAARCCVTTDCCGQRDLIEHDRNGLLFPVGDVQRLVCLIERCFRDRPGRQKLAEAAQASVRDRDWADVSREVADRVLAVC